MISISKHSFWFGFLSLVALFIHFESNATNIHDAECQYSSGLSSAMIIAAAPADIFISEYVEGSASNKYIEVFNGTGISVDLSNYQLRLFANGSSTPSTTTSLTGMLADGAVIVYSNSGAIVYTGPTTNAGAVNFNGDDAIAIYNVTDSLYVDIFGNIGSDPGSAWSDGDHTTRDQTLRRKSSVMMGVTTNPGGTGPMAFTTMVLEWDDFDQNTVTDLGMHTIDGPPGSLNAVCANPTLYLDINGDITVTADDLDGGSTADSFAVVDSVFSCDDIGLHSIMLIAYDSLGNADTCTATVTISDSLAPIAMCASITVYLDGTGAFSLDSNALENGSTDNCGVESVEASPSSLTLQSVPIAGFEDLFFSEYVEGSSSNKYLEVYNGTGSAVDLSNYEIRGSFNGGSSSFGNRLNGMLADGDVVVYGNTNAAIYLDSVTVISTITFNGDDAMILYNLEKGRAADIFGVIGDDPGSAWTAAGDYSTQNKTLVRKSHIGHGVLNNPSGTGPTAFGTLASQWDVYDIDYITDLGMHAQDVVIPSYAVANNVVTDGNGNIGTCESQISLIDTFNLANIVCSDTTLYLDNNGELFADAGALSAGSQGFFFELDNAIFDCSNLGANSVTVTATGSDGMTQTCMATLTVADTTNPFAICADTVLYLDMSGNASLTAPSLDGGSGDNCSVDSFHITQTMFDTSDVGMNAIILTVFDAAGNMDSCVSAVTVVDTFSLPFVSCQDITVYLDSAGMVSITASDVNNGSTGSISIDSMNFDCSELGNNIVVLTATNIAGTDTCQATVTVADTLAPLTSCMDITVYLDGMGMAMIDSNALNAGSTDNCGVESINVSQSMFSLADLSSGSITDLFFSEYYEDGGNKYLEVYNGTGDSIDLSNYAIRRYTNGSSTVSSTSALSGFILHGEVIVYRNTGSDYYKGPTTSLTVINFNGDDAMELYNTTLGEPVDIFGNIGEDPGSAWTAPGGYTTADVDLRRKISVKKGVTIDPSGSGFPTLATEWDLFAQADTSGLGMHIADTTEGISVTQTATDASGNAATCTSNVIVIDTFNISALAACMDVTVYLDGNGEILIDVSEVDAGSIGDTIFITENFFTCGDIGAQSLLLIAQDTAGMADSCEFDITIIDALAPNPMCQDITIFLDENGMAMIDSSDIDNGSTDNCGIVSITLSQTAFTFADTGVGPPRFPTDLFISEYVEGSGNNKYIEIYNGTGAAIDLTNYELQLFGNGATSPTQTESLVGTLNDGETKVYANSGATLYGGASTTSNVTFFNGDDALALYKVSDTAFVDIFGSIGVDPGSEWVATDLSTLNMTSRRKAASLDGITVNPGGSESTSFTSYFDNWDSYLIDDISGLGSHTIDTSGINGIEVTMTVTDSSGNVDSCSALVTVINLVATAVCTDTTVYLDASGNFVVTPDLIDGGSVGDTLFVLDGMVSCGDLGIAMISLVALDDTGESDTCQAMVTVVDTVAPVASCANITVYYDATGMVVLDSNALDDNSTDNCEVTSFSLSQTSFSCGTAVAPTSNDLFISEYVEGSSNTTRYLEIYNGTGASMDLSDYQIKRYSGGSTFAATATLSGTLANGAVVVYMNPLGDSSLYAGIPLNSVMTFNGDDAIELYKISADSSIDIFGRIGDDPGTEWTLSGHSTLNSTLSRKSSVLDGVTINPTGTGPGAFITLFPEWDNFPVNYVAGLGSHTVSASTVTNVNVTQTVTDGAGNSSSCTSIVSIADTTAPVVVTQDITITLDVNGIASITTNDLDNGTDDNCSLDTLILDITDFDCSNVGDNTVTLTATDASGNASQGTANVRVLAMSMAVVFVDGSATGANNGSSWTDAFTSLAVALANSCYTNVDTVFIAAGTYLPDGLDRNASFEFSSNTVVLGGYVSGGASRDVNANQTILSGDAGTAADPTDNLYHVVHISTSNTGIILDGLTISSGNADGGGIDNEGAGVLCEGGAILNQVTITENQATGAGSAISVSGSNADLLLNSSLVTNSNSGAIRISVDNNGVFLMEDSEVEEN